MLLLSSEKPVTESTPFLVPEQNREPDCYLDISDYQLLSDLIDIFLVGCLFTVKYLILFKSEVGDETVCDAGQLVVVLVAL